MHVECVVTLHGRLRLSDENVRRTAGTFSKLINDNAKVFERYFGAQLFPGSLNVDVLDKPSLQQDLDAGRPLPTIRIPKTELINMPAYIGDGQAWPCRLRGDKFPRPINCWVFRRIGSKVPHGVLEIVAAEPLRAPYNLQHGDSVVMELLSVRAIS